MTGRDAAHSRLSPGRHARSAASVSAPARQFAGPAPPPRLATTRVMAFYKQDGQPRKALEAGLDMTRFGVMKHLHVLERAAS